MKEFFWYLQARTIDFLFMFGTISILFYPKKKSSDQEGLATLYARITVNGQRSEFSLGRKVEKRRWCTISRKLRGTTKKVADFNYFLDQVSTRCHEIYDQLLRDKEYISAQTITDTYLGKHKKQWQLLEIFQNHNNEMTSLVGTEYSSGTLQRYKTALKHTKHFITSKYNRKDLPLEKVNHHFITSFEYFLKSTKD